MPIDYSKWSHIEVSDDEDDTHPNIDTPSLFKWRHQARVERDAAFFKEKETFDNEYKEFLAKLAKAKEELRVAKEQKSNKLAELEETMKKLSVEEKEWEEKNTEMQKKIRLKPWNIDTICHEGNSFTAINHVKEAEKKEAEEDVVDKMKNFVAKYEKTIKQYGMFQKPQDTLSFLKQHPYLVCDETANHLVLWCIELAMEEKDNLMEHVSHQCIVMQFMLELAKSRKCDPRAVIAPFFSKFMDPEPEYHAAFQAELSAFRERIKQRAQVRLEEAVEKVEAEEREQRLGPGGLDPVEVFESLPVELQKCFESKDVELLKTVLTGMEPKDAEYHLKRCIDSGLWVENAADLEKEAEVEEGGQE